MFRRALPSFRFYFICASKVVGGRRRPHGSLLSRGLTAALAGGTVLSAAGLASTVFDRPAACRLATVHRPLHCFALTSGLTQLSYLSQEIAARDERLRAAAGGPVSAKYW